MVGAIEVNKVDFLYFNDKATANEMVYKTSISDKEMSTFILRACLLLTGPARMNIEIPASDIGKVDSVLPVEIEGKYNVYAIWSNDKLMYIGKSSDIRQRLRNHLFGCSEETGSKLDLVKKEAISMRLDSHQKRELISKKLGINLDSMIKNDIIIKSAEQNTNNENKAVSTSKKQGETIKTRKSTPVNSKPILTK